MTEQEILQQLVNIKKDWQEGIGNIIKISIRTSVNTAVSSINVMCQKANNFQEFKAYMELLTKEVEKLDLEDEVQNEENK